MLIKKSVIHGLKNQDKIEPKEQELDLHSLKTNTYITYIT